MLNKKFILLAGLSLVACSSGKVGSSSPDAAPAPAPAQNEKNESWRTTQAGQNIVQIQNQLDSLIQSDFGDCRDQAGDLEAVVRKICEIAQASTNEARIELKGEIAALSARMQAKIDALEGQLQRQYITNQALEDEIARLDTNIASLDQRMNNFETALRSLQNLLDEAASGQPLPGSYFEIKIGKENMAAGPTYESVLLSSERDKLRAYAENKYPEVYLIPNAFTATVGSKFVNVYSWNHDMVAGNVILMNGAQEGAGLPASALTGEFIVYGIVDANNFTIEVPLWASYNQSFGGSAAKYSRIHSRGLSMVWTSTDGPDAQVRTTHLGSKPYNFIIKQFGPDYSVCYSKYDRNATFATLDAAGTDVACFPEAP